MPLSMLEIGESAFVKRITGNDEVRQHLIGLGFVEGIQVKVMNKLGGNLIIALMDGRVALAEELAARIFVG